jgi:OPA family glycerol-3-phosphate transporter-like MFS transporter
MKKLFGTAAIGLVGLGLGLAASALPAAAASGARLDMSKVQIALLLSIGLWTRAATAFCTGALIDRFGGRRALRTASVGAAVACLGLGLLFLGGREGAMFVGVAILHASACYFLTFPGPAAARLNATRLDPAERGRHAGLYAALAFPAEFLALPAGLWLAARIPLSAISFLPAAAAILALAAALRAPVDAHEDEPGPTLAGLGALACRGNVLALAALEACAGVVRWGLLGWSAQFLSEVHQIRPGVPLFAAALTAAAAGSAAGPALCGLLSDKAFGGRRAPAALIFFAAQAAALVSLGRAKDPGMAIAFLALACAAAFGTHALLSGAAAMDVGGRRSAGAVCGLLDGAHHAAGGLAILMIGALLDRGGWGAWTMTLIPFSLAGAAASLALTALKAEVRDPAL